MPSQITIRSSTKTTKPPPKKSTPTPTHKKSTSNVGEVAGGTTANICVICCCCPCVLFEFIILTVYKLPVNVIRRVWKKSKQKCFIKRSKKKKAILECGKEVQVHVSMGECTRQQYVDELSDVDWREFEKVKVSIDGSAEEVELDKLMWDRFRDAGFWRTPSQRLELNE